MEGKGIDLSTKISMGHLLLSAALFLGGLLSVYVSTNVRISTLELEVYYLKESSRESKEANGKIMDALHRIELKMKDKEDRQTK